ncbi:hypothetical protein Ami103574_10820 [Aminipila butyrica]|uniref:Uncharacterized protein n=1 Tax=Aminipila butyrica TaxID=433296 RepID=A0A858BUQ3_9FIRM|nr:hypothetical protein [Aminipila butyrica]QIB69781.1 hypothetical protein Ami103574_10820 [Aminipila butyrica]
MAFEKLKSKVQTAFKENKKILPMLGSIDIVDAIIEMESLKEVFNEFNLELVRKDYATIDELLHGIKEHKNVKYLFISDMALIGIDEGKYEVIRKVREEYPDITIAMFFNDEKPDEPYKNWAYGYKVYHIYYANSGAFDFDKIIKDIAQNAIPVTEASVGQEELEKKEYLIKQKEKELEEKEYQLQELEKKLAETENLEHTEENSRQIVLLKEQIKNMQQFKREAEEHVENIKKQHEQEKAELTIQFEQEKKEYKKQLKELDDAVKLQVQTIKELSSQPGATASVQVKTLGCITIGVFSISPGAGSTYTSISLGEQLGAAGYPTAVIAMDGKKELKYAPEKYADYIVPDNQEKQSQSILLGTISKGYNFVIEDFGYLFPLSPNGKLQVGAGRVSDRQEDVAELLRCSYKIAVGFSDPWHIGKLNFFIDNQIPDPLMSIFSIKGYSDSKELGKCSLPMCERDSEILNQLIFRQLGISVEKERQRRGLFK